MTPDRRELHGVFLGTHAVAAGYVTRPQLRRYRRLMQNVYADPALNADHELYSRGAALLLPPGAALGGRSAAAWFGAPFASAIEPVLVVAPRGCPWDGPRGVRVHKTDVAPGEIWTTDDGIPLTRRGRTAWDVAAIETVATAVGLLDAMVRSDGGLDLAGELARRRGRWRSARVGRVFPLVDGRAQSPPESWVRVACHRAGLPAPVPQFVVTEGGWSAQVDLAWPEAKLIVEYEGEYHFDELQIRRDDRRYARLVAAGWRVIRLSANDLRDLDGVVSRIRVALREAPIAG
ncbi:endonuclease domain-containing protein [Goekera deserti]|uniref:DUF559 domain-containing protein n=1 Tax=Goekera deserti TaxID=2497753 RepID=A0A7K3WCD0_9ACTN|nr:DUF559 domain-containing protein [Goekera deserti]NDI49078.1 DUF559 domain-containing protein [Goekera deserti]NEL54131.1 DUF559 domain-containing protein [Goekera deserti]